jgi:RNA polymerase sigma-70 factor (ECF subfamily)
MPDDEPHLIQQARQGDAAACAALYDCHYEAVYRYCYYHVGDTALAQDLASEVFVRMVENLDTFDVRGRPLLAWLYAIARNLVADAHRQRGQMTQLSLDEVLVASEDTLVHQAERHLMAEHLVAVLAHLTEEQRQVILFKFVLDHSNAEVARLTGKSEGAIKSLQHRALAALRRTLEKEQSHET